MCGEWNRDGRLCGKCRDGFYPLALSYDMTCQTCPNKKHNIWKFILLGFGPLTVFCLFVLLFKVKATSSYLHGFLLFFQCAASPIFIRVVVTGIKGQPHHTWPRTILKIITSLYGIWNLDFFRLLIPGVCLDMSTLSVLTLDYLVAVYPYIIVTVSYILVNLHSRHCKPVVLLWKPFQYLLSLFKKNWDFKNSLVDAYATFFIFSFYKFAGVSYGLLVPTTAHDLQSPEKAKLVLYYDGSIEYFSKEHIPYAVLAISVSLVFVIFPIILLCVYPFRWFQACLNFCHLQNHSLRAIMDSFQGSFNDGTEPGTRDCRCFAAFYLIICQLSTCLVAASTHNALGIVFGIMVILSVISVILVVKPHKRAFTHYNSINVSFLILLAFFYAACTSINLAADIQRESMLFCFILICVIYTVPLLYVVILIVRWIIIRRRWCRKLINRVKFRREGYEWLDNVA